MIKRVTIKELLYNCVKEALKYDSLEENELYEIVDYMLMYSYGYHDNNQLHVTNGIDAMGINADAVIIIPKFITFSVSIGSIYEVTRKQGLKWRLNSYATFEQLERELTNSLHVGVVMVDGKSINYLRMQKFDEFGYNTFWGMDCYKLTYTLINNVKEETIEEIFTNKNALESRLNLLIEASGRSENEKVKDVKLYSILDDVELDFEIRKVVYNSMFPEMEQDYIFKWISKNYIDNYELE